MYTCRKEAAGSVLNLRTAESPWRSARVLTLENQNTIDRGHQMYG